jgi:hypothetical protein
VLAAQQARGKAVPGRAAGIGRAAGSGTATTSGRTGDGGSVAGITPAPPVVAIPGTSLVMTAPANAGGAPVVLLPDGRLFANFGRGYEQVVQPCGYYVPYADYGYGVVYDAGTELQPMQPQPAQGAVQPVVVQPSVTQPSPEPGPSFVSVPVVPSAATGLASLPSLASQVTTLGRPVVNARACWARGRRGQIFVAVP